eukprot:10702961-Alexandrium_andersonii.AAC.1
MPIAESTAGTPGPLGAQTRSASGPADSTAGAVAYTTWPGRRWALASGLSGLRVSLRGLGKRPKRAQCLQGSARLTQ